MDIRDDDSGMTYTPHTGPNGEVGFKCTRDDGGVTYITLNPSGGSDDGVPTVFLYIGDTGDVLHDTPAHFYDMSEEA
jgi:hypothetical protein